MQVFLLLRYTTLSMKKILAFLTIVCLHQGFCQIEDEITAEGIADLKIGTHYKDLKSKLEKKPVMTYYSQLENEYHKKHGDDAVMDNQEDEECYKMQKAELGNYKINNQVPSSIEVVFDENNTIKRVSFYYQKDDKTCKALSIPLNGILGRTLCGSDPSNPNIMGCSWDKENVYFHLSNMSTGDNDYIGDKKVKLVYKSKGHYKEWQF